MANCDLLSAGLTVINSDCANFLATSGGNAQFDVAFVDPPFAQGLHTESCRLLEQNGWLKDNALIYCELPSSDISFVSPPNWELQKDKIAGGVRYMLYSRIEPNV